MRLPLLIVLLTLMSPCDRLWAHTLKLLPETRSIFVSRIAASRVGWLFEGKSVESPMKYAENAHKKVLNRSELAFVLYDFRHTSQEHLDRSMLLCGIAPDANQIRVQSGPNTPGFSAILRRFR